MNIDDLEVGQFVEILEDMIDDSGDFPTEYKDYIGKPLQITRIEKHRDYPIFAKDTDSNLEMHFRLSEIKLSNNKLFNIKKESQRF